MLVKKNVYLNPINKVLFLGGLNHIKQITMKKINLIIILASMLFSINAIAQDRIIKINSDTIYCKIIEIGTEEIKYILTDYSNDLTFTVDVEKVRKVILNSGKEIPFTSDLYNPENYTDNKKHAIKFHFLSPMMGNASFAYEKSIAPGRSMEFGFGYIYGNKNSRKHDNGIILRAGYKFMTSPDFYVRKLKYSHILKGPYIKPELIFNSLSTVVNNYGSNSSKEHATSISILITAGKQVVYSNFLVIDYYVGVGYGYTNNDNVYYYYSNTILEMDVPISFTMGLKIGVLFR